MRYTVVLEYTGKNWSAYVPDLPGCVATGQTRAEVEERLRGALEMHLRGMVRDGDQIPAPGTWTTEMDVDLATDAPGQVRASA